jgi:hypothetical protein
MKRRPIGIAAVGVVMVLTLVVAWTLVRSAHSPGQAILQSDASDPPRVDQWWPGAVQMVDLGETQADVPAPWKIGKGMTLAVLGAVLVVPESPDRVASGWLKGAEQQRFMLLNVEYPQVFFVIEEAPSAGINDFSRGRMYPLGGGRTLVEVLRSTGATEAAAREAVFKAAQDLSDLDDEARLLRIVGLTREEIAQCTETDKAAELGLLYGARKSWRPIGPMARWPVKGGTVYAVRSGGNGSPDKSIVDVYIFDEKHRQRCFIGVHSPTKSPAPLEFVRQIIREVVPEEV